MIDLENLIKFKKAIKYDCQILIGSTFPQSRDVAIRIYSFHPTTGRKYGIEQIFMPEQIEQWDKQLEAFAIFVDNKLDENFKD